MKELEEVKKAVEVIQLHSNCHQAAHEQFQVHEAELAQEIAQHKANIVAEQEKRVQDAVAAAKVSSYHRGRCYGVSPKRSW